MILSVYVIAFALAIFAVGLCIKLPNLRKKTSVQSFPDYWKKARKLIDKKLEEEAEKLHFARYMKYALKGGKRFRGALTLLFTQALGGSIEDALPFSVAIEFIHAGALVHDDFFDMHEVRRGKVPLYRILDPRRAFLIADMLLSIAQAKLAESRNGYKALAKAIYEACRGACLEPLNPVDFLRSVRKRKIPEEFYIRLIRLKTAELFGTACKFGGIASNASPEFTRRAYEYGIQIGLAYQMADDLVDYMIACKTGEIDVPKMVKLLPALFYFAPSILTELATKIIKGKVGFVDCLRKMEIRDKCEQEIRGCLEQAKEKIDPFPGSTYKELLLEAPDFLIEKILEEIRAIEA